MSADTLLIHVDVDAFFASVEQLLIPALRGRPVIVGNGVIASCSYEARVCGLHAGMELHRAKRQCPGVVILDGHYATYHSFAEHVWDVCGRYTCGLETFLDEAYGDATGLAHLFGGPERLGRRLQEDVRREVGLPVSVGLAANRMLAKIGSAAGKPGGVVYVAPGQEERFLARLPIRKLPGVGRKTAALFDEMNIATVADLRSLPRDLLRSLLGRRGEMLYERCRGRDYDTLRPEAPPKTISRETTFHAPTCDRNEIHGMLFYLIERAMRTARDQERLCRCVALRIRYADWKHAESRRTLPAATDSDDDAFAVVLALLERLHTRRVALRHVGVVLSSFTPARAARTLFNAEQRDREQELHAAVDRIRDRWGHASVVSGQSIELLGRLDQNDYGFVLRTPSLTK